MFHVYLRLTGVSSYCLFMYILACLFIHSHQQEKVIQSFIHNELKQTSRINTELSNRIRVAKWIDQSRFLIHFESVGVFDSILWLNWIDTVMTSLLTLPVHLVYHILDDLQPTDIFLSAYNVCSRLNSIIDSYHPYQVKRKYFFIVYHLFFFNVSVAATDDHHPFFLFVLTRKTVYFEWSNCYVIRIRIVIELSNVRKLTEHRILIPRCTLKQISTVISFVSTSNT